MKPRVHREIWVDTKTHKQTPRWHVEFEDSCGCIEEVDFPTFETANRFARHIASGGSRWEFVA